MADLTGKTIANTYKDLLQTGTSGTGLPSDTPVNIQDGEGKSSGLKLSQNQIDLTGTVKIKGTELTANVSALNAVADFTAVSGFATGNGAGTIVGRTFSASTGMSITNADGISGRPTFSLAESGVTSGTYSGQTGLFDVDNTGRITAVNTTDTVSVGNVNTVNLSATTADFSGNVSIGGTLTMSGAISPSSVSTTGDVNGVNFNASGDISATALNVGGTVSAVDYYGDGSNLTGIVATSATNASYAASAGEAQTAVSASHAVSADFAASTNNATFASTATNASFAASATNATNATSAVFASSATNATNAINVDYGGVVETSTANIGSVSASNIFVDGNVSVGGTFDVSGAVSIGGGLFVVGDVSAGNIHAGGIIYGNGAGLFNVPSESGGTVNFVKAGDGLHALIDNTTTTNPISASGTIALDFDQTFGAVSASSLTISSSASFADNASLNFGNNDDLQIIHNGSHSLIRELGQGDLFVQSNTIKLTNTGAFSMLTLSDGADAEFPYGVQVSGTVSATSFVGPTITSINNSIASVSATTSVNAASITALSATMATSIANHLPLAGGTMTGAITLSGNPSANLEAATKQYVDNLTNAAIHFHEAVRVESPDTAGNLNATYDNGTAGVGATLTNAGTQAALVIDGVTMVVNDRVLIYNQTDQTENGVYTVTDTGSASTNWVLTRATDADSYEPNDNNGLDGGSYFYVEEGNTGAGEAYVCNNVGEITFGTTNITFTLFSSALVYTAGSGININSSRVVSTSGVPTDADLTALSATMATSINNTNTNVTALSATMATSINNTNTNLIALSATLATSISNYMPKSGGTFTGDVNFGDNNKAQFGAGNDLQMFHDGSNSVISDQGTGNLYLQSDGTSIRLRRTSDGMQMLRAEPSDGSVRLFYGGTQKFITKSDGVDITGELQADSLDIDGAGDISGNLTLGGNLDMQDGDEIKLGNGDDLRLYHDGSNSIIQDVGTGSLIIEGTNLKLRAEDNTQYLTATDNAEVTLYYNNASKLATKSDGIDITGELQADSLDIDGAADITGNVTLGGNLDMGDSDQIRLGASQDLLLFHEGPNSIIRHNNGDGDLIIDSSDISIRVNRPNGFETAFQASSNSEASMWYNNSKRVNTTDDGARVLGSGDGYANLELDTNSADKGHWRLRADSNPATATLDLENFAGGVWNSRFEINQYGKTTFHGGDVQIPRADNLTNLTISSTDGDANFGPRVDFYRNSSSPADNDLLGTMVFQGENSTGETVGYGQILAKALDVTDNTEDGELQFKIAQTGTLREVFSLGSNETVFNEDSRDINFRVESNGNSNAIFVDGGTDKIGIMKNSPVTTLDVSGSARAATNTDTTNSGNVQLNFTSYQNHVLTLTGNVTLTNPSSEATGQSGFIIFIQDGTGSRTVSLGSDYETAGGAGLTLSTAGGSVDLVPYVVQSSGNILLGTPQLAFS